MVRFTFAVVALVFLLGEGLLFGFLTNRWQDSRQIPAAVVSLERVPLTFGDWRGQALPDFDDRIVAQAGFAGHFQRRYENPRKGIAVSVLLACGPFGPLSVHTPDICFAGNGFVQQGDQILYTPNLGGATDGVQFWMGKFGKPDSMVSGQIRVYWAWNGGHGWQAPRNPRLAFAGAPVLYKLYVMHDDFPASDKAAEERCNDFFSAFLPQLGKSLANP